MIKLPSKGQTGGSLRVRKGGGGGALPKQRAKHEDPGCSLGLLTLESRHVCLEYVHSIVDIKLIVKHENVPDSYLATVGVHYFNCGVF